MIAPREKVQKERCKSLRNELLNWMLRDQGEKKEQLTRLRRSCQYGSKKKKHKLKHKNTLKREC